MELGKQADGTWVIRADRLGELTAGASKVIRRAGKTGTVPVSVEVVDRGILRYCETLEGGGRDVDRVLPWVRVSIAGEAPVIGGFRFVARVEHHMLERADGSRHWANIISKAPGVSEDLPSKYREVSPHCEHCETNRRRNDTFLLRSEYGTLHQIGRNCLADFVRGADVADALGLWRLLSQLECMFGDMDEGEGSGGGQGYTSTLRYLATVCGVIRKDGWLSKSAAIEQGRGMAATAVVADALCCKGVRPEEQDLELAGEVIGWAQGLGEREDLSDYLHNVRTAVALGYVDGRHTGIVASSVVAYQRELEQEVKRARKAARGPGQHVGTVGKRTVLEGLTVTRRRVIDGHYGAKTVMAFEDAAGNELVWFASGIPSLQVGDTVGGKATVKSHGEYEGRAQTVLTRCAFAAENTVAASA